MREFIDRLLKVEQLLSEDEGPLDFFALFLREESPNRWWDLLFVADWAEDDDYIAMEKVAAKLKLVPTDDNSVILSRLVVLEKDMPELKALQATISTENGVVEIFNRRLFGLKIEHAYIITSKPSNSQLDFKPAIQPKAIPVTA